ncbi:S8 family serine peptidase [Actinomadura rudentiformis]|uniref:S8 family serine peptidase n=1 Tax=Actinomadura rudentiformis TaxID=359158 RepID=A0A6H9Y6F7_9ACTN|nr:S8 family serine peptidase [Actinomadura rudentiformis]KAB2339182.1 S8 family serine peptidase [Actinomadura rudentiformis]
MPPRRIARAALGAGLIGALAVPLGPTFPAGADTAPAPAGPTRTVTLLTGDMVKVRPVKGRLPLVTVTPGSGRKNRTFSTSIRPDGHVVVLPADMTGLVGKVIDPALFDVTELIEQGYDDARSRELPLIVQRSGTARAKAALGGNLRETRALPSIGAVAVRQPRAKAPNLGNALAGLRTSSRALTTGVKHIWLDRKLKATTLPAGARSATALPGSARGAVTPGSARAAGKLDRNLTQVGAPRAWGAGATGRGTRVAVLDTGVDPDHPDLRGRVAETANFSESPDTADRFGHGTHVAATIAGTGAAAKGERKGVAPDAELLIGKVLDDDGNGTDSGVLAGMEWAASRAKVVNMSLGGDPSDGTDPLAEALNTLTQKHGTLFVVAAGNAGEISSVSTPATADEALAVGAVNGSDKLAEFSSRGPRTGRYAAKPEIVAPGVDIIAARAQGTRMGNVLDAEYTSSSGTSMAAPHVAGAAALVLQRHPDWTPQQIKAALVGSTDPATGGDAFERGSGRLNAGTAVTAPVVAALAAPHLGTSAYPAHPALSAKIGWRSTAGAASLDLSVKVTDREGRIISGVASVPATVEIPAGGSNHVAFEVKAPKAPGLYTAEVTAKGGGVTIRTPVTFYVEPPSHTLTIVAKPLPNSAEGKTTAKAEIMNLANAAIYSNWTEVNTEGTTQVRVPAGRYGVLGKVYDTDGNGEVMRGAIAGTPEVLVDRDLTVTLDGSVAKPVKASVQGLETKEVTTTAALLRTLRQGSWATMLYNGMAEGQTVYVQPMGGVQTGSLKAYGGHRLTAPGKVYDLIEPFSTGDPATVITPADQARMAQVEQRFAAFDGDTSMDMRERRVGVTPEGLQLADSSSDVPAGSTRTDYLLAPAGTIWFGYGAPRTIEWVDLPPASEFKPGSRTTLTWGRQPLRPGPANQPNLTDNQCQPAQTARTRGEMTIALVDMQARPDGWDCILDGVKGRRMALSADGKKIGEYDGDSHDRPARFAVPTRAANYELTYENDASDVLPVSVRTSTKWTFRSAAPSGQESVALPLVTVDYDLALDLLGKPTGKPATFDVPAGKSLKLWTSLDDGKTWQSAQVTSLGSGRFSAPLPKATSGQGVSIRVHATDAKGNAIDQDIIRAYRIR